MAEITFGERLQHAWNVFRNRDPTYRYWDIGQYGYSYGRRPDRTRLNYGHERSIVTAIYNRISIDVANVEIQHVKLDENERYLETIHSNFNRCLTLSANKDQTSKAFIQDLVLSMFDEGSIAVVPVDTDTNPDLTGSYNIESLRVGRIREWWPDYVRVDLYNDRTGQHEEVVRSKKTTAIIENPMYAIMNESNSTLARLIRTLNRLDNVDEQTASGKLDIIFQVPYTIKSDALRKRAEDRRKDIEMQLTGSAYGIAYADATERITQLNRPAENNLQSRVEYLTNMLYSQLGLTQAVFDGTAEEAAMLNYYATTIEPILSAIVLEFKRKFLTKTAITQHQSIMYFRDPFKLVPVSQIADIADKFTRNEILSSNEMRAVIGYKPVKDARADELRNKNLNATHDQLPAQLSSTTTEEGEINQNGRI